MGLVLEREDSIDEGAGFTPAQHSVTVQVAILECHLQLSVAQGDLKIAQLRLHRAEMESELLFEQRSFIGLEGILIRHIYHPHELNAGRRQAVDGKAIKIQFYAALNAKGRLLLLGVIADSVDDLLAVESKGQEERQDEVGGLHRE